MWLKATIDWVDDRWAKFEAWVSSWFPGAKTRIMTGLGAIGTIAASLQEYVTGLPVTKYISAETLTVVSAILFTLSFWFRGLGDRVEARKEETDDVAP
jgi:hypothetical protein